MTDAPAKAGERGKPILFSAPMVRALLAGAKTQTRRLLAIPDGVTFDAVFHEDGVWRIGDAITGPEHVLPIRYRVGDRLWVREEWSGDFGVHGLKPRDRTPSMSIWYWADGSPDHGDWERPRPSIHMPRWASRLTLIVTDVRVQRLQDISEEDARAEGCPFTHDGRQYAPPPPEVDSWQGYGRASFSLLWEQINGAGSWAANPWVAAYTFTVHRQNIDALPLPAARDAAMTEGG